MNDIEFLDRLVHSLANDDHRMTSHPVWCVQAREDEEHITLGADYAYWRDEGFNKMSPGDCEKMEHAFWNDDDTAVTSQGCESLSSCYRMEVVSEYVTKQVFLTEAGANDCITRHGHNIPGARVYVDSAYMNEEIKNLRRLLPELVAAYKTVKGLV